MDIPIWLEGRRPAVPADLLEAMTARVESASTDGESPSKPDLREALRRAALSDLASARSRPGRVRESAFDLLSADGLLTYACEAALEADDSDEALRHVLRGIDGR